MSNRTRTRRSVLQALGVAGAIGLGTLSTHGGATHESGGTAATDGSPSDYGWRTAIGAEPDRVAVAGNGVVYAASTSDSNGAIAALDPETGERQWEIHDQVVRRPVANREHCFYLSDALVALDEDDGSVAWEFSLSGPPQTPLCIADGTLYVGWGRGAHVLAAVDATDGSLQWASSSEGHCLTTFQTGPTTPVAVGDTVFAETDSHLTAFRKTDGDRQWESDYRVDELAGGSDLVVVAARSTVRAVRPDGSASWTRELPAKVTGLSVVPAGESARSGVVVARTVGSPAGHYRALSLADGSLEWTFSTDEGPISMPTTARGTGYAATGSGHLHAFDPATGEVARTYDAAHGLHDRPAVVDGTVAVPSDEGFVYGFEAP